MGFGGKACQVDEDGYSQRLTKDCGDCCQHGEVRLCSFSEPARISSDLHNKRDIHVIVPSGGRKEAVEPARQYEHQDTRRVFERIQLDEEMEFLLRRMIMKRVIVVLAPVLMVVAGVYATGSPVPPPNPPDNINNTTVKVDNDIDVKQSQSVSVDSGNASSNSDSASVSGASISTSSVSNYETRTPPLTVFPPYLPYWNHGGWGTIKAYFPNGPSEDNQVYEQTFDPDDPDDMRMLRGVLESIAHDGPLEFVGGILNGVGAVFGGADNYHHGRGFEISNSLVRCRRPGGKPLLVFIDSNVDTDVLRDAGYAYVGKVSLEGKVERNWDQVYDAAVAEALPWNVDILLVSGGMRGVTAGSTLSFPGAAGGYSQANYSVSLFGAASSGITEGKGKAVLSATGYRFWPDAVRRRKIPQSFYNRIHASYKPAPQPTPHDTWQPRQNNVQPAAPVAPATEHAVTIPPAQRKNEYYGVEVSRELLNMAGF